MFNAVRMDIYRLIHTKSAYVILVIAMALAIAMSGMTALVRSMATESIVETTDDVTMVSESDSEIADEYDTASAESSGISVCKALLYRALYIPDRFCH